MSLFSDVFPLLVHFVFFAVFSYCLHFAKFVCLLKRLQRLKQEWQKSPAGTKQTYGKTRFGWRNRKQISQIIKDYFYLPFFLLIILWLKVRGEAQVRKLYGICLEFLQSTYIPIVLGFFSCRPNWDLLTNSPADE
jgi:hypothetical protein